MTRTNREMVQIFLYFLPGAAGQKSVSLSGISCRHYRTWLSPLASQHVQKRT
ncbi:unnamed protein product [Spirodela intermedia]|uniref:Uncharacterized protein n=1 Tax=Spirodela intermedia TaxID=51605 RepID=A0A7I8K885_SPIIN|nr:unnamed protein product [Spirodela intermedia]